MAMQTKSKEDVLIKTDRFTVRPLKPEDSSRTLLCWLIDPELMYYLGGPRKLKTEEDLSTYIENNHKDQRRMMLGVFQDESIVGVYWVEVDGADLTARTHHLFGEKTLWGTGAPLEVRGALMDWLFGAGIARVIGTPMTTCTRAINGYIRQGFTLEGIMKSGMLHRWEEKRHDLMLFRMLPEEWDATKRRDAKEAS